MGNALRPFLGADIERHIAEFAASTFLDYERLGRICKRMQVIFQNMNRSPNSYTNYFSLVSDCEKTFKRYTPQNPGLVVFLNGVYNLGKLSFTPWKDLRFCLSYQRLFMYCISTWGVFTGFPTTFGGCFLSKVFQELSKVFQEHYDEKADHLWKYLDEWLHSYASTFGRNRHPYVLSLPHPERYKSEALCCNLSWFFHKLVWVEPYHVKYTTNSNLIDADAIIVDVDSYVKNEEFRNNIIKLATQPSFTLPTSKWLPAQITIHYRGVVILLWNFEKQISRNLVQTIQHRCCGRFEEFYCHSKTNLVLSNVTDRKECATMRLRRDIKCIELCQ